MPLPTDRDTAWPPSDAISADLAAWSAWYSGEIAQLAADAVPEANRRARVFFWRRNRQSDQADKARRGVHVPLAAEIAQGSADLLFGDVPEIRAGEATDRLWEIAAATGLHNTLLEAAEVCAALSGVYLCASWDTELRDEPFLTVVHPDRAVPEFRQGVLVAVTFWRELGSEGRDVYRHLERHEDGVILHGLYLGTQSALGTRMPLEGRSETSGLEPEVRLPDGLPGVLAVWYVPNVLPDRRNRRSYQGRADIQGAEDLLDALDETYSSWMRDIRLGKARIIVPHDSLESGTGERGGGKYFDAEREVFSELEGLDPEGGAITPVQFAIRCTEHRDTALSLVERIVSAAGYSPQTFGLRIEGRAESGTALRIREGKTDKTIARKQRYWAPAVESACEALLALDRALFERATAVERPQIVWPEEQQTPTELAETLDMLRRAEAISTETAVRMAQPELSEEDRAAEVERINAESGRVVPSPLQEGIPA